MRRISKEAQPPDLVSTHPKVVKIYSFVTLFCDLFFFGTSRKLILDVAKIVGGTNFRTDRDESEKVCSLILEVCLSTKTTLGLRQSRCLFRSSIWQVVKGGGESEK